MASIIQSVEYLTIDYDATSEPVTKALTKGQDELKCVPFFTQQLAPTGSVPDDWRERSVKVEIFDDGGTATVRASAPGKTDASDHTLKIFVIEFVTAINVQQVNLDIADTAVSGTAAITSVGAATSEAFLVYNYAFTHSIAIDRPDYGVARIFFNSVTEIQAERPGNTGTIDGIAYIVDCDSAEFIVDHRRITIVSTDELTNETISATVLADTFTILHYEVSEGGDDPLDAALVADLSTTTNVRVRRTIAGAATSAAICEVQVIECQNNEWFVERADFVTTTTNPDTTAITAVTQANSIVKTGTHESCVYDMGTSDLVSGNSVDDLGMAVDFNSNVELGWDRDDVNEVGNIIPWEVIDFTGSSGPVITDVNTTETWDDGDTGLVITGTGFV